METVFRRCDQSKDSHANMQLDTKGVMTPLSQPFFLSGVGQGSSEMRLPAVRG